jgi:hypothetical protein
VGPRAGLVTDATGKNFGIIYYFLYFIRYPLSAERFLSLKNYNVSKDGSSSSDTEGDTYLFGSSREIHRSKIVLFAGSN